MSISNERLRAAQRFFAPARDIGGKTGDQEARACWQYLRAHAYIGQPLSKGQDGSLEFNLWRPSELGSFRGPGRQLIVVPLFPGDERIDETFNLDPRHNAIYYSNGHYLVVRSDDPEVPFVRGCRLLHEGYHARQAQNEGRICVREPEEVRVVRSILEEGDVLHMVTRLWRERGGPRFRDLLERIVQLLQQKVVWGTEPIFPVLKDDAWLKILDQIFGPAPNERTRTFRADTLLLGAYFELIERQPFERSKRGWRGGAVRAVYEATDFPI